MKDCVRAWQALVRPVLEYGTIVREDVKWEQAERVQRDGKMILRCSEDGEGGLLRARVVDIERETRLFDTQLLGEDSGRDVASPSCLPCLPN